MTKIIFLGTNDFASQILEYLIKTNKNIHALTKTDRKSGRKKKLTPTSIKKTAIKTKTNYTEINSINEKNTEKIIKNICPDLIIVCEYGEKIKKNIINIPKLGIINIHPSLLPKYRGPAPLENAILNDEQETGISIIKINEKIDSGDIIYKKKCKILPLDNYTSLKKKLIKLSKIGIKKTIDLIIKNKIIPIKQNEIEKTYAPYITKANCKINWNDSANNINNKIRALSGKYCANTTINNIYIKILKSIILKRTMKNKNPGYITKANFLGIDVSTKDKTLRIKVMQISGKIPMHVKEILNSKQKIFTIGNKFE